MAWTPAGDVSVMGGVGFGVEDGLVGIQEASVLSLPVASEVGKGRAFVIPLT